MKKCRAGTTRKSRPWVSIGDEEFLFLQGMQGHRDIKTTQVHMRASIRALKDTHSARHPVRLTRATLKPGEAPATVAELLEALDAKARAEGETEE